MSRSIIGLAVMVAAMIFAGQAIAENWTKIRIGVEGQYPPFSSVTADGNLVGFDIEIANALCEQMSVECELVTQHWDGMIPALQARKYDAIIASMSITEERKKKVEFTNSYYKTPAKFVREKGSGIEITQEDLRGKTVGVQRSTIYDNFVSQVYGAEVEVKRYSTRDDAYLDMVAGRVDLLLADSVALDEGFLKTDTGKDFEFVGPSLTDPKHFGEGAGIAVRKEDAQLKEMLNAAIEAIVDSGEFDRIAGEFFNFSIHPYETNTPETCTKLACAQGYQCCDGVCKEKC